MPDTPSLKPVPRSTGEPRALNYAPPLTLGERVRGWFPSGEQFVNVLKTLIWVAPLTLLIWIYAEREQTVTVSGVTFPVDVRTVDPDRWVMLRSPADKNIIVELSGPRAMVDRVRDLLQPKPDAPPVLVHVDPQLATGGQELLTVAQINNHHVFRNNGITVKSAQPPYLRVDIDTYVEREVPVRVPPDVAGLLGDQTRFAPDRVRLRAPKHLIDAADEEKTPLVVYADLGKREELRTKTGVQKLEGVPVYWSRRESVTLAPVTVTATLDIKQRDVEWTIPSVTIFKESPAKFEDAYVVDYEAQIKNVAVTGPPEQIEKLKSGEFKYRATFEVSAFDPPGAALKKPLRFELPQGVQLTKEAKARTDWTVTIKPLDR
jgi:hypothetical protein